MLEAIEAALPYERIKADRIAARRASLTRECQAGDLDVYDAFGEFEWEHHEPLAAQDWWEHACERGRLMSCLFTGRYSPQLDTFAAHNAKARCARGESRYCEQLREMVDSQRAEIEKLRARGVTSDQDEQIAKAGLAGMQLAHCRTPKTASCGTPFSFRRPRGDAHHRRLACVPTRADSDYDRPRIPVPAGDGGRHATGSYRRIAGHADLRRPPAGCPRIDSGGVGHRHRR